MAKQKGFTKIQGTLGETTFLETRNGNQVREKARSIAPQIKSSPAFARTRENNIEFGRACKVAKLLKTSLAPLVGSAKGSNNSGRLVKKVMTIVKKDMVGLRGQRNVMDGPLTDLEQFEMNDKASMTAIAPIQFATAINRLTGVLSLTIPSFIPTNIVKVPEGTTHFRFVSMGVELEVEQETSISQTKEGLPILWDKTATAPITVDHTVTPASTNPLMLALGLQFFQLVSGQLNPILLATKNSVVILKVNQLH